VGVGVLLYAMLQFVTRTAVAVYETLSQLIAYNNFAWGIFTLGMVSCAFGIGISLSLPLPLPPPPMIVLLRERFSGDDSAAYVETSRQICIR